jgi:transposase
MDEKTVLKLEKMVAEMQEAQSASVKPVFMMIQKENHTIESEVQRLKDEGLIPQDATDDDFDLIAWKIVKSDGSPA